MTIKKSDLYRSLWQSCDELRGGMDASQYKDYILTLLFVKYVTDKAETNQNALIEVPVGGSFQDILALRGNPNIGEGIDKVIGKLADANDLRGVIDVAFFNDEEKLGKGKEMVDRLSKLVAIFNNLDFRGNRADGDDLLGDAYEYLMRHFATESGKSKGQFYTPAEVSRILARVVGVGPQSTQNQTVYDPTAGSGSLLLKAADEAPNGLSIYGQEKDLATWALAKMNMILHGYETAVLEKGDTLSSPAFVTGGHLKQHDFVVANPPFSTKSWSSGINPAQDEFRRFEYGIPPAKNGDYAFLLHAVASLKSTGRAAVILPHGVLFRGNVEMTIRKALLTNGLIKGVIGLPANLFYGTGIPACIVVIDKGDARAARPVFMIEASRGYAKDGNKNRLRAQDLHRIIDTFTNEIEVPGYSRLVPFDELSNDANNFNLNITRYVDSSEPEDVQDLDAHLAGGVPNHDLDRLTAFWEAFPSLRSELFTPGPREGYSEPAVTPDEVPNAIGSDPEFLGFRKRVADHVSEWLDAHRSLFQSLDVGSHPKGVIHSISEDLLKRFESLPLLDAYDVYEELMAYWAESMADDVYLISADGWVAAAQPRSPIQDKERKISEEPDLTVGSGKSAKKYKMDLLPPNVVASHFFSDQVAALVDLQVAHETAAAELAAYVEEHGVDEGLVEDALNDKGKATKASVAAQLKALKGQPDRDDELAAVRTLSKLVDTEASAKAAVKASEAALGKAVVAQYTKLTEEEVKSLVIDEKWARSMQDSVRAVVDRQAQKLANRLSTLDKRYARTLSDVEAEVQELRTRVHGHIAVLRRN